jgi:hypothetical protein
VLGLLSPTVQLFELTQVVGALAPLGQAVLLAQIGGDLDGLSHRVPQQVDVRGVVNVRLDYEGVTARGEIFVGLFFYQYVPGIDHLLIDAIKDFGREQAKVVLQGLQLVFRLVGPVAVTQHLAQRLVLIGQFLKPVEVGVQAQSYDPEHEDPPLLHSRSTRARIGLALASPDTIGDDFAKNGEDPLTQFWLHIDVLQAAQQLRYVVS